MPGGAINGVLLLIVGTINLCQTNQVRERIMWPGTWTSPFLTEPIDQTAIVGESVTFPCRGAITMKNEWRLNDYTVVSTVNNKHTKRYSITGSHDEGENNLHIKNVQFSDEGIYVCVLYDELHMTGRKYYLFSSRKAKLTVNMAPKPPIITQGAYVTTIEDNPVTLECVTRGKPAPDIIWVDENKSTIKENVQTFTTTGQSNSKTFIVRSVLTILPNYKIRNQSITCLVKSQVDKYTRTANVWIDVKYAPKVLLLFENGINGTTLLKEGTDAIFECKATSNPSNVNFTWYINDKLLNEKGPTLVFTKATRQLNEKVIKCEVTNEIGKSEESRTLEIIYGREVKEKFDTLGGQHTTSSCERGGVTSYGVDPISSEASILDNRTSMVLKLSSSFLVLAVLTLSVMLIVCHKSHKKQMKNNVTNEENDDGGFKNQELPLIKGNQDDDTSNMGSDNTLGESSSLRYNNFTETALPCSYKPIKHVSFSDQNYDHSSVGTFDGDILRTHRPVTGILKKIESIPMIQNLADETPRSDALARMAYRQNGNIALDYVGSPLEAPTMRPGTSGITSSVDYLHGNTHLRSDLGYINAARREKRNYEPMSSVVTTSGSGSHSVRLSSRYVSPLSALSPISGSSNSSENVHADFEGRRSLTPPPPCPLVHRANGRTSYYVSSYLPLVPYQDHQDLMMDFGDMRWNSSRGSHRSMGFFNF